MSPSNRNPPFFSTSHQDSPLSTFRNASTPENILYGFQSSQPKNDQQFPSYHQASRSTSFLRGSSPISHGLNSNQYDVECARTLYFGNLPNEYLLSEFLDLIRGGSIESIKHLVEKNCIFITFLDPNVASQIYDEMNNSKILFKGEEIKVGWGKPSAVSPTIQDYVMKGASRNVFLGNMESFMTPEWLKNEFERFGSIDTIKVISDKKIGFVHLTSINSAINAVNSLAREDPFSHMRLYYGKDRCASPPLADDKKHTADPTDPKDNRTVYLGGIHPDVTTKELCDVIRGGILQQIKYFPEKNIAFATFIEAEAASSFYNRGITDGLMLKNKRIKFGWGKPSPLPPTIAVQVEQGASRNVYIGLIDEFISEETLRQDFSPFGEIELINRLPEKRIAFVSFTDITYAIKAVEEIIENPFYAQFRINFGKDRCGNAIRPSKSFLVSPPSTPTNEILKN
ncbi:hypothetical protein BC833DRAFT_530588 [Globomyces pollinis-pini]|nr:hypothetical protein BC833DRAFT_530588 [Globomyces pollinis-pini]